MNRLVASGYLILSAGMLLSLSACASTTPMHAADTTYTFDITINSEPQGALIYSMPSSPKADSKTTTEDFGYEHYGMQQMLIGTTPYKTQMECVWDQTNWVWHCTGPSIALLHKTTTKQDRFFLQGIVYYQNLFTKLNMTYSLAKEGYKWEPVSVTLAEGDGNEDGLLCTAASHSIETRTQLLPARQSNTTSRSNSEIAFGD